MATTLTIIVTFDVVLVSLLLIYGAAVSPITSVQSTINQIIGPWPSSDARFCQSSDLSCNLARIGDILLIPFVLIGSLLFRIGALFFLMYQLINVLTVVSAIPFIGPIFVVFQILLGFVAFSHIRGNDPGI